MGKAEPNWPHQDLLSLLLLKASLGQFLTHPGPNLTRQGAVECRNKSVMDSSRQAIAYVRGIEDIRGLLLLRYSRKTGWRRTRLSDGRRGMIDPLFGKDSDDSKFDGRQIERSPNLTDTYAEGVRIANWWLMARRLREDMFRPGLFADPAWDFLLDLYTAEARGERVQVTSLTTATAVPHSTAIRRARLMTEEGLLVREQDPRDGRRIYIRLSAEARLLMEAYFEVLSIRGHLPTG